MSDENSKAETAQRWLSALQSGNRQHVSVVLDEMSAVALVPVYPADAAGPTIDIVTWVDERCSIVDTVLSVIGPAVGEGYDDEGAVLSAVRVLTWQRVFDLDKFRHNESLLGVLLRVVRCAQMPALRSVALTAVHIVLSDRTAVHATDTIHGYTHTMHTAWNGDITTDDRIQIAETVSRVLNNGVLHELVHGPLIDLCVRMTCTSADARVLEPLVRSVANLPRNVHPRVYASKPLIRKLIDYDATLPVGGVSRPAVARTMSAMLLSRPAYIDAVQFFGRNPNRLAKMIATLYPDEAVPVTVTVVVSSLFVSAAGRRLMLDGGMRQKLTYTRAAFPWAVPMLAGVPAYDPVTGLDVWQTLCINAAPEDRELFGSNGSLYLLLAAADRGSTGLLAWSVFDRCSAWSIDVVEMVLFGKTSRDEADLERRLRAVYSHPRTVQFVVDTNAAAMRRWSIETSRVGSMFAGSVLCRMTCRVIDSTGTSSMFPVDTLQTWLNGSVTDAFRDAGGADNTMWNVRVLMSHGMAPVNLQYDWTATGSLVLNQHYYETSRRSKAALEMDALLLQHGLSVDWSYVPRCVHRTTAWAAHEARTSPVCLERAAMEQALEPFMPPELVRLCGMYVTIHPEERSIAFE